MNALAPDISLCIGMYEVVRKSCNTAELWGYCCSETIKAGQFSSLRPSHVVSKGIPILHFLHVGILSTKIFSASLYPLLESTPK